MSLPATIYARFSSIEQGKGSSIVRQIEACKAFASANGWTLQAPILDEGKSAFAGSNRIAGSGLHEFERKAKAGHYANGHVILCEHLDRISRQGWQEVLEFLNAMTASGVTVATVDGARIYSPGERIQMGQVMEIILKSELAWEESEKKSKRVQAAWTNRIDKVRQGSTKALTKQVHGWMTVRDGEIVLIEDRAAVLREIYDWSLAGFGGPAIVKRLNDRKEPTWGNSKTGWQLGYVTRLLTTRAAIGEYEPMKRARHIAPSSAVSKGERFLNYYPAAIDVELFNRVQEARAGRRGTGGKRGVTQSNIFSGIAKCAHCGGRMTYSSTRKAGDTVRGMNGSRKPVTFVTETDHSFLQCDNAKRAVRGDDGELCPNRAKVRYEHLEPAILKQLLAIAFDESSFAVADETAVIRVEVAESERQLDEKRQRLDTLVDSFSRTGSAAVEKAIVALEAEIAVDDAAFDQIKKRLAKALGGISPDEHLRKVKEIHDALNDRDPAVKLEARVRTNQAMKSIITHMTCDGQKFTTVWIAKGLAFMQFNAKGELTAEIALPARVRPHLRDASLETVLEEVRRTDGNTVRVDGILNRARKGAAPASIKQAVNAVRR